MRAEGSLPKQPPRKKLFKRILLGPYKEREVKTLMTLKVKRKYPEGDKGQKKSKKLEDRNYWKGLENRNAVGTRGPGRNEVGSERTVQKKVWRVWGGGVGVGSYAGQVEQKKNPAKGISSTAEEKGVRGRRKRGEGQPSEEENPGTRWNF